MKQQYPGHEQYRKLYLRYYDGRDVGELLQLLEPLRGTRVLDLCGGGGRLALAALDRGASVVMLVDAEPFMVPDDVAKNPRILVNITDVGAELHYLWVTGQTFERIACRQAVNYWLDDTTARLVASALKPHGVFAFNTFNQKPPDVPRVMQYKLDNFEFVEVSWLAGNTVHHVQIREGMEPHTTQFAWIPPEHFREMLEPHFTVTEERRGKTSLYRCEKK